MSSLNVSQDKLLLSTERNRNAHKSICILRRTLQTRLKPKEDLPHKTIHTNLFPIDGCLRSSLYLPLPFRHVVHLIGGNLACPMYRMVVS